MWDRRCRPLTDSDITETRSVSLPPISVVALPQSSPAPLVATQWRPDCVLLLSLGQSHHSGPHHVTDTTLWVSPCSAYGGSSPGLDRAIRFPDSSGQDAGSYSLLPITLPTTAACVDRSKVSGMKTDLYDRLESYEENARRYGSLKEALK